MKVIIAGSRHFTDMEMLKAAIVEAGFHISEVVSGTARGADHLGELWAEENQIEVKKFPADWARFGKMAGPVRNKQMAEYGEALIALWDGVSRGTKNMISLAKERGLQVYVKTHQFTIDDLVT